MNKDKNQEENLQNEELSENQGSGSVNDEAGNSDQITAEEYKKIKAQLSEKTKQCEDYLSSLQRAAAEFDNYKKRTAREKEALYTDAFSDAVAAFLPVADNMERAVQALGKEENQSIREGVELVFRQLKDVMKNLGIEEIKSVGEKFDPQLHNAVMHIEDESYGDNEVVEEFQRGYKLKDKVIRHSMVKVAN